jgi:Protein of unknown function (DUF732)
VSNPNPRPGQLAKGILLLVISGIVLWALLSSCHSSTPSTSTSGTWSTTTTPESGDALYLRLIKTHIAGITNTDGDAGLIKGGHVICDGLSEGRSRDSISRQFTQGHCWSDSDASWLITVSVVAYLPGVCSAQ